MFTPGSSYYVITEDQYNELSGLLAEFLEDYPDAGDLMGDFVLSDDGFYVADPMNINADEASFLADFGIGYTAYKKSTQSTNFFG